jgi:biotin carboxylase
MTKVLAVYPGPISFRQAQVSLHKPILDALGIQLVLADDVIDAGDRDLFADAIQLPPPQHVGEALARIERWLASNAAHAVLAQSESGLFAGALVARKLGVPCISPEAALLTTSKHLCREVLERARVPQPRFALASTAADVRRFAGDVGYPVVLKGVASALARLVELVRDESALDGAVERMRAGLLTSVDIARLVDFGATARVDVGCDPRAQFLVEAFAKGAAVETDGVVAADEIRSFGVTEQALSKPPLFFMEGYLLPADRPAAEIEHVESVSNAALRALGVANTGFSIELRLDAGRASIIEVNGRLGWDEGFGDLFAAVTGAQPAFQALEIALGRASPFERRAGVHAAVAYACCYENGIVARVPDDEEIARVEREHGVRCGMAVDEGDRTFAPPHPDATPHLAFALATDGRSSRVAYSRARAAVDALRFEIAPLTSARARPAP